VFALRGAHVVLVARSLKKAEGAIKDIKALLPTGQEYTMTPLACDLSDLKSVNAAVKAFKAKGLPLHYLIANAGIMALPERQATADGHEMQMGTNHLGHFYLITELIDILEASSKGAKPSRVVIVSSLAHENSPNPRAFLTSDTLEMPYVAWGTYGDSKLANIIFAKELNERYKSKGILAFSLHPGLIGTNLDRNMSPTAMLDFMIRDGQLVVPRVLPTFGRSIPQGTATQVYAALRAPESEAGLYLSNCNVEIFGKTYPQKDAGLMDNIQVRKKFWSTSQNLVSAALKKLPDIGVV